MRTLKAILLALAAWCWAASPCLAARYLDADHAPSQKDGPLVDGLNEYTYVQQNPWSKFDPEGLQSSDGQTYTNSPADLLKFMANENPQGAAAQAKEIQAQNEKTVAAFCDVADFVISLHPAGALSEAITGKSASGKDIDGGQQILSGMTVLPMGGIIKGADALFEVAKAERLLKLAKATVGIEESAGFIQKTYSANFSTIGQKLYSGLAGTTIKTVDDLAEALKAGKIKPSDIPVDMVVKDGNKLIVNTRTAAALEKANIPRKAWVVTDMTKDADTMERVSANLKDAKLDSKGTDTVTLATK